MTSFLQGAADLLDAASNGMRAGHTPSDTVILIGADRSVRVICASGWSLEALRRLHGTCTGYRVSSANGLVRVDGSDTGQRCTLEAEPANRAARMLLGPGYPAVHTFHLPENPMLAAPSLLPGATEILQTTVHQRHGKTNHIEVAALNPGNEL